MSRFLTVANLIWLTFYLALMAGIAVAMFSVRGWSQQTFSTRDAQADWQAWKQETARQAASSGPVERREAQSNSVSCWAPRGGLPACCSPRS